MMNLQHEVQSHAGGVGAVVTATATAVGWTSYIMPVLQAISLLVAIVAGVLTAWWYWKQLKDGK